MAEALSAIRASDHLNFTLWYHDAAIVVVWRVSDTKLFLVKFNIRGRQMDKDLEFLRNVSNEDLDTLVKYIRGAFSEMMSVDDNYKRYAPDHSKYVGLIEDEIRRFGGNTFVNLFRGSGPDYREIVGDVADKLNVKYPSSASTMDVEDALIFQIFSRAWNEISVAEREEVLKAAGIEASDTMYGPLSMATLQLAIKQSGFLAYKIAVIVANAVARAILGRGLSFAANAVLTRTLSIFAGPIGWAITGAWTAIDVAGPAYRVTTPCVLHIAMLRRKYMCAQKSAHGSNYSVVPVDSLEPRAAAASAAAVAALASASKRW